MLVDRDLKVLAHVINRSGNANERLSAADRLAEIIAKLGGIDKLGQEGVLKYWADSHAEATAENRALTERCKRLEGALDNALFLKRRMKKTLDEAEAEIVRLTQEVSDADALLANFETGYGQARATMRFMAEEVTKLGLAFGEIERHELAVGDKEEAPSPRPANAPASSSLDPAVALYGALTEDWRTIGNIVKRARARGFVGADNTIRKRLEKLAEAGSIDYRQTTFKEWKLK